MSDTIIIKSHVSTGYSGCDYEDEEVMDRSVWEAMSEEEQCKYLDQAAVDLRNNYIDCNAWVVECAACN